MNTKRETWAASVPFEVMETGKRQTVKVKKSFPADTPYCDIDDELQDMAFSALPAGDWEVSGDYNGPQEG